MATRNRDINKRMNWFDRQFLRAQDFMDEQDYHLDRHRRHNRWLHTPGVVEGLGVSGTIGTNTVTVAPGTALDPLGRVIVLSSPAPVTLPSGPQQVELYILYSDAETDPSTDPGVTGNTRITETATFTLRRTLPGAPEGIPPNGILLARANLNSANGQLTNTPPNPDDSVRTAAAAVVDNDITVNSVTLKRSGVLPAQRPRLSCSAANEAALENSSLRIDNTREIFFADNGQIRSFDANHRLVFNRANNRMELHEFGDILFLTGNTPSEKMRLLANGNLGLGTATPGAHLEISNPWADWMFLRQQRATDAGGFHIHNPWRDADGPDRNRLEIAYRTSAGVDNWGQFVLHGPTGNVGIGTGTPQGRLDVSSGESPTDALFVRAHPATPNQGGVIHHQSATNAWQELAQNTNSPTDGILTFHYVNRVNPAAKVRPNVLTLRSDGNVGIGTITPRAKLEVSGGAIMPSVGNNNASGIQFPPDPGGGGGDEAFIRYFAIAGETTKLMIGINNDLDDSIGLLQAGAERMTVINGNVGIGTTTPLYRLHVLNSGNFGGENANGTSLAGSVPIIAQSSGTAFGIINGSSRQAFALNIDGDLGTTTARGVPTFYDKFDGTFRPALSLKLGCVGIGIANPAAGQRLHVAGNVLVQGGLTVMGFKSGYVVDKFINNLGETLEEGDVVVIGDNQATGRYGVNDRIPIPEVDLAQRTNDTRVCGIVCQVSTDEGHGTEDVDSSAGKKDAQGTKKLSAKLSKAGSKAKATATRPGKTSPNEPEATDITKVGPGQMGLMVTLGAFAHCKVDADIAPIKVGDLLTTSPTKGHAQKVKDPAQAIGAIVGKALGALKKGKGTIPVIVTLQ